MTDYLGSPAAILMLINKDIPKDAGGSVREGDTRGAGAEQGRAGRKRRVRRVRRVERAERAERAARVGK